MGGGYGTGRAQCESLGVIVSSPHDKLEGMSCVSWIVHLGCIGELAKKRLLGLGLVSVAWHPNAL